MKQYQKNKSKNQEEYERLEREFLDSLNFVELRRDNFSTTSVGYTNLLQSICKEIEGLFITYGKIIDLFEFIYVNDFEECFSKMWESDYAFIFSEISVIGLDFDISPWSDVHFLGENRYSLPDWWEDYKKIDKSKDFVYKSSIKPSNAEMKSVLFALAALYILNIAFMKDNNRIVINYNFETNLFKVMK